MLLAIDVGNTNTVIGVFTGTTLGAHWRLETREGRTADEYAALLHGFFALSELPWRSVTAAILATVVPAVRFSIEGMCQQHLGLVPLIVGPGIKSGMPILYDNPREVGADRIVNAVAAYERWKQGCIVVDFGTATTFDVVTPRGEYLGGAIAPGLIISADALYEHAAKLPRVEIVRPRTVIGKNTVASMQAGLVFGYVGLVDEIVERMRREVDFPVKVLATGGLAPLIARESRTIEESDELLTLTGLRLLHERNR
ncbi:MAG: type III pantothenate kinase [Myxococcales bacterium]|nr:type III pantothenate kinase [Myxococcales bacterium]